MMTRRESIKTSALFTAALAVLPGSLTLHAQPAPSGPFKVPPLPYEFDALEPYIDAKTMEIHHDKHHQAYVTNLNKAIGADPDLSKKSVEELVRDLAGIPEKVRTAVRNQASPNTLNRTRQTNYTLLQNHLSWQVCFFFFQMHQTWTDTEPQ